MNNIEWDAEADIVVVGTGAAGSAAASTQPPEGVSGHGRESFIHRRHYDQIRGLPLDPQQLRSAGAGIEDKKEECLKFLARANYPELYNPDGDRFGLSSELYDLLAAYYDNGYRAIDFFMEKDICQFVQWKPLVSDYVDHVPENKVLRGEPSLRPTGKGDGCGSGPDTAVQRLDQREGHRGVAGTRSAAHSDE
ncbi:hypothetical protein MASR1M66_04200 [Aminivibrio sp.]